MDTPFTKPEAEKPLNTLNKFKDWLVRRGRNESTARLYAHHVGRALALGDLETRLLDKTLAPKTRRAALAAIRAWGRFRGDSSLLERLSDLKLPTPTRKAAKRPLDPLEHKSLLAAIDATTSVSIPMRAVLGMMARRGFRVGDVLRLRSEEVREALKTSVLAYEAKGGARLEFGVRPFVEHLQALADTKGWRVVDELIAPDAAAATRRQSAVVNVERALRRVAEEAGLDTEKIHPHRLRRTVATMFLDAVGGDITKLKDWMQWTNIATAASYVDHSRRVELDEVAEKALDKLDGKKRRK